MGNDASEQGLHAPGQIEDLRKEVSQRPWYQMIELAPGFKTPGWYDLGAIVERLPWPDLAGKRCLDVGTSEGFFAFEMERRGAASVLAVDVFDAADWDWPARTDPELIAGTSRDSPRKANFDLARRVLGSSVERLGLSAYDLDPEQLGTFDFVFCGSLLVHLRDPIRAIERIRSVCAGSFVSMEPVALGISFAHRNRPLAYLAGDTYSWWLPNAAAYRKLLEVGGFEIERSTRTFGRPTGPGYRAVGNGPSLRGLPWRLLTRAISSGGGIQTISHRARPA